MVTESSKHCMIHKELYNFIYVLNLFATVIDWLFESTLPLALSCCCHPESAGITVQRSSDNGYIPEVHVVVILQISLPVFLIHTDLMND